MPCYIKKRQNINFQEFLGNILNQLLLVAAFPLVSESHLGKSVREIQLSVFLTHKFQGQEVETEYPKL